MIAKTKFKWLLNNFFVLLIISCFIYYYYYYFFFAKLEENKLASSNKLLLFKRKIKSRRNVYSFITGPRIFNISQDSSFSNIVSLLPQRFSKRILKNNLDNILEKSWMSYTEYDLWGRIIAALHFRANMLNMFFYRNFLCFFVSSRY